MENQQRQRGSLGHSISLGNQLPRRSKNKVVSSEVKDSKSTIEDTEMDAKLLIDDFTLMLEVAPSPAEVFPKPSNEYCLAHSWLNKLSTWQCSTIYERRMRNAYMSHLCMCLNQKRLSGIFMEEPPELLEWVDFTDTQSQVLTESMSLAMQASNSMMSPKPQPQSQQSRPFNNMSTTSRAPMSFLGLNLWPNSLRNMGGIEKKSRNSRHRRYEENASSRLAYLAGSSIRSSLSFSSELNRFQTQNIRRRHKFKYPRSHLAEQCMHETDSKHLNRLLNAIRNELSGNQSYENNIVLENELQRYQEFKNHHQSDIQDNMENNQSSQRVCMLLDMQMDLLTLLIQ